MDELITKVKRDLLKSGFPLQLQAGHLLPSSGFTPLYSQYYLDVDEDKGREIDVVGQKRWLVINSRTFFSINLSARLAIECKTSNRPWVFYTVPSSPAVGVLRYAQLICAKPDIFRTMGRYLGLVPMHKFFPENHHHSKVAEVAVAFQEPFASNQDRDPIFQALIQAAKAAEFYHSLANDKMGNQSVALIYPIVVFSGQLVSATFEDNDLTLNPTDHLVCQFAYRSFHYDRTYLVDVVTLEYLPVLLGRIQESVATLGMMIAEAPHAPKTVEAFGLTPRNGVDRKRRRFRKAKEEGVEVITKRTPSRLYQKHGRRSKFTGAVSQ